MIDLTLYLIMLAVVVLLVACGALWWGAVLIVVFAYILTEIIFRLLRRFGIDV